MALKADTALGLPYHDQISALVHDPTFKAAATGKSNGRASRSACRRR
ncbi:MAG: hypothetical protein ABW061_20450 [Polyangiaceae bacterium]